jgi:hypothetical protein
MRRVRERLSRPASSELEWQERRELLPPTATVLAGDEHSRFFFVEPREVLNEAGRVLELRPVDEYGRTWLRDLLDAAQLRARARGGEIRWEQ